jgi:hypothetical protein
MRFAALYHFPAIRIKCVVDHPLRCILFMVVLESEMPEALRDSFQAWSLRLTVQRVVGVGAIHDPPQQHQGGVASDLALI